MPIRISPLPDILFLNECLKYQPRTGKMFWRERPQHHFATERGMQIFNGRFAGKEVGSINANGYLMCGMSRDGKKIGDFMISRIAWALHHNEDPGESEIDHRDNDEQNNRIKNLRKATRGQNTRNMSLSRANTSGVKGVSWCKVTHKWFAYINARGKRIKVGRFDDLDEATTAVHSAREKLHKTFTNHG